MGIRFANLTMLVALALPACDHPIPPTGPSTRTLNVQGPARMEVAQQAQFLVTVVDAQGGPRGSTAVAWSSSSPGVLRIDAGTGMASALRVGESIVSVTVGGTESAPMRVVVVPKLFIEIQAEDEIDVGEVVDAELIVGSDSGEGGLVLRAPLSALGSLLGPGQTITVQWSTTTPSIISLTESLTTQVVTNVRGLQPGLGIVRVSVAGLTAETAIEVVAAPLIGLPVTPLPPGTTPSPGTPPPPGGTPPPAPPPASVTPGALNGSFGFSDLRRGASDCGLGLLDRISGTFDVDSVPASGNGGHARLNYGSIYDWVQMVVVMISLTAMDFQSESMRAPIPGYQVFVSGRFAAPDRAGTLRFNWVADGQPRTSPCAVFEGTMQQR